MAMRFSIVERGKGARIEIPAFGTNVEYVDHDTISDALTKLHYEDEEVDFVALGYEDNSTKKLVLVQSGLGGVDSVTELVDEKNVLYFLFRIIDVYDEIPTTRFAFVTWIGDGVSGVKKARMATNKADILSVIGHYNVELVISSLDELTQENIRNKIADGSGSRVRVVQTPQNAKKSSGLGRKAGVPGIDSREMVVSFPDRDTLDDQMIDVRDDESETNWCLFGYDGPAAIVSKGAGSGGIEEMASALDNSDAFYGLLRVDDVVDKSNVVRFVYVVFVGVDVRPMRRGAIVSHKGNVEEIFQPYHFVVYLTEAEELNAGLIEEKLAELKK